MSDLDRLFYWRGVAPNFYNFRGELTEVPIENRLQIIQAMGVDTSTEESIAQEAFDLDIKPWLSWLPPLEVISFNKSSVEINFHPDELNETFNWSLRDQEGNSGEGSFVPNEFIEVGDYVHDGIRYSRRAFPLNDLALGYYEINLSLGDRAESTTIAITPEASYIPEWCERGDENLWGFVVQLYTLRSEDNWGIGDFGDLAELVKYAANVGADIIGLNPFHALQTDLKHNYSPYSPSDRRFLSPLYIDVTRAPGYRPVDIDESELLALREQECVPYEKIRELKYSELLKSFTSLIQNSNSELLRLRSFVESHDESLVDFVNYEAEHNWQSPTLPSLAETREGIIKKLDKLEIADVSAPLFYCYMQWVAAEQLAECQALAGQLGMKVGLVRDLAVGANGGGSEVQTNGHLFCHDASVGAPPDPLALTGQNWGIPPMDPAELRKTGFTHFINLLRENMRYCGALRIDHAMSLYRLWWCPPGATADKGAYIYYPFEHLLGLVCLESHLNQCVIIAEDLGIVPNEFREAMNDAKLFSNRVFYFEKWNDLEFKHPKQYERHALAMLDNHDVPTLISWWNKTDLDLRAELNLLEEGSDLAVLKSHRESEKAHLMSLLHNDAMLPESWRGKPLTSPADDVLVHAIILFAAQSESAFFILQLEDLLMMNDPVNVPGTYLEHKNWCRKLVSNTRDIFSTTQTNVLLKSINELRKGEEA